LVACNGNVVHRSGWVRYYNYASHFRSIYNAVIIPNF
jgi:hypothetical protein